MIVCEHLTRYYGSFVAVDDVCFELPSGSVCAMVGPNGAGKSTTMRMLATLLLPSRGHARIAGLDVVDRRDDVRQLLGYLPEAFSFYDDMVVERYLMFFALAYNLDPAMAQERIEDFLERLGLGDKRAEKVGALSRGMKQRLGVAKSFLHDPQVVLLDEPASGLDPVARAELRDFLRYQQHLGKTVVVSSHVLKELADFCEYILILDDGRVKEFGRLSGSGGVLARYSGLAAGGLRYTFRVLKDAPRLELILKDTLGVTGVTRRDQTVECEIAGGEEAAAAILAQVAGAGIPVTRFAPEVMDLEGVYRKAAGAERLGGGGA
ncbi:MAG: ABC transporter ATP-binding protein [Planctomycetes bacterium]|nr:ABC transporter ATP-binding protein [Planctomycetota bacterium]